MKLLVSDKILCYDENNKGEGGGVDAESSLL